MQSFFWSVFSCIRTEYGDLWSKSLYSVRIWENTDQKNLRIWTFFMQCLLARNFMYGVSKFKDYVYQKVY